MVTVKVTGLQEAISKLRSKLLSIAEQDSVTRIVASSMAGKVRKRIHVDGENGEGGDIGEYADSYMMIRKKNNRGASKKVILSLTRELENDFGLSMVNPIKTSGGWGIGFVRNTDRGGVTHAEISEFLEKKYGNVWVLTKEERQDVINIAQGETDKILRAK